MILNPGSTEAIEMGCKCDPIDNNNGAGRMIIDPYKQKKPKGPYFWYSADCEMHFDILRAEVK